MTPTDTLRAMLDERSIEHFDHENGEPLRDLSEAGTDPATSWRMDGASVCAVPNKHGTFDLWIDNCTPEQAIAATVGGHTDLAKRLREVTGLHSFAELFGFSWEDGSDWTWHDVACAMADAVDAATAGAGTCDGSFHKPSDLSSGRVPLYYCKDTNRSIFVEREAKACPLCGGRIKEEDE